MQSALRPPVLRTLRLFAQSLLITTLLFVGRSLLSFTEAIALGRPSAAELAGVVLLTLPHVLVLTIPISVLFALTAAAGRETGDPDARIGRRRGFLRQAGLVLALVVPLTLIDALGMAVVVPWGNTNLQRLRLAIHLRVVQQIGPKRFSEVPNFGTLYIFDESAGDRRWRGVFLDTDPLSSSSHVTVGRSGDVTNDSNGRLVLRLEDAVSHTVALSSPERYRTIHHETLDRTLEERRSDVALTRGLRELTIGELRGRLSEADASPEEVRVARVEIHKKFAVPAACLVFALLALGIRRPGRSHGVAFSVGVTLAIVAVYSVMLSVGEAEAAAGRLPPWLSMWLPNILFTIIALLLLARNVEGRMPSRPMAIKPIVHRMPSSANKGYILAFALAVLAFVIVGVGEHLAFGHRSQETPRNVGWFLGICAVLIPMIAYRAAPWAVFVAVLAGCRGRGARGERLGGQDMRLALLAAIVVAIGSVAVRELVVPAMNGRLTDRERIETEVGPGAWRYTSQFRLAGDRHIYYHLHWDQEQRTLLRPQVFEFDQDYRLTGRLFAERAKFEAGSWIFAGAWERRFPGLEFRRLADLVRVDYPETPDYYDLTLSDPTTMRIGQFRRYVKELKARGVAARELEVALHRRLGYPLLSLLVTALTLAAWRTFESRGAGRAVVSAVLLVGMYTVTATVFLILGGSGILSPAVAVWAPGVGFSLSAVLLLWREHRGRSVRAA